MEWVREERSNDTVPNQGPAGLCHVTGRELTAGEKIYSVLLDEAGQFVQAFAVNAWPGPPEGIAWWCGRIPASDRAGGRR